MTKTMSNLLKLYSRVRASELTKHSARSLFFTVNKLIIYNAMY